MKLYKPKWEVNHSYYIVLKIKNLNKLFIALTIVLWMPSWDFEILQIKGNEVNSLIDRFKVFYFFWRNLKRAIRNNALAEFRSDESDLTYDITLCQAANKYLIRSSFECRFCGLLLLLLLLMLLWWIISLGDTEFLLFTGDELFIDLLKKEIKQITAELEKHYRSILTPFWRQFTIAECTKKQYKRLYKINGVYNQVADRIKKLKFKKIHSFNKSLFVDANIFTRLSCVSRDSCSSKSVCSADMCQTNLF